MEVEAPKIRNEVEHVEGKSERNSDTECDGYELWPRLSNINDTMRKYQHKSAQAKRIATVRNDAEDVANGPKDAINAARW
jgi:hypothetical protein